MDALDKVRSEALRRDVAEARPEAQVVIVELDLPKQTIGVLPEETRNNFGNSRFRLGPPPDQYAAVQRIEDTRHAIEAITGKPADMFLRSSGSFIVEATGEQIRRVAELQSVAAIWPNLSRRGLTGIGSGL